MILPNQLTVLRIILTPVFVFFFFSDFENARLIALIVFLIAALTDWYDGWLARKFNYFTSWGKFWDPLADKILTSSAFLSLAYIGVFEFWMVIIIIFRDFFVTFLRNYADKKNYNFITSRYAKWKTFIQMVFLYYILIIFTLSEYEIIETESYLLNENFVYYSMFFITIMTIHSGITYVLRNRKLFRKL